jgi:hypothetical protein
MVLLLLFSVYGFNGSYYFSGNGYISGSSNAWYKAGAVGTAFVSILPRNDSRKRTNIFGEIFS